MPPIKLENMLRPNFLYFSAENGGCSLKMVENRSPNN